MNYLLKIILGEIIPLLACGIITNEIIHIKPAQVTPLPRAERNEPMPKASSLT